MPYDYQEILKHKDVSGKNAHDQFCALVGCPPSGLPKEKKFQVPKKSLYGRTISQLSSQRIAYNFTAALNNTLLLTQVVLGAALTALGASASSHILITVFGVMNTIIAGLVAYLKSRGQPMRARMHRDDLERIVDEIENSEVMWRGISDGVHGYDEIDTDEVTVRSEVARLTRLYERAIRLNGMNNPDMYMAGAGGSDGNTGGGIRSGRSAAGLPAGAPNAALPAITPAGAPQPSGENVGPVVPLEPNPEDAAPATKAAVNPPCGKPKGDKKDQSKDLDKTPLTVGASDGDDKASQRSASKPSSDTNSTSAASSPVSPQPARPAQSQNQPQPQVPATVNDPDASPATAARLKPKRTKSDGKQRENAGEAKKVSGDDEE